HRFGKLRLPDGDRGIKVGSIGAGCRALDLLAAGRRRDHDGGGFELDGNGAADGSVDGGPVAAAGADRLARATPPPPRLRPFLRRWRRRGRAPARSPMGFYLSDV